MVKKKFVGVAARRDTHVFKRVQTMSLLLPEAENVQMESSDNEEHENDDSDFDNWCTLVLPIFYVLFLINNHLKTVFYCLFTIFHWFIKQNIFGQVLV